MSARPLMTAVIAALLFAPTLGGTGAAARTAGASPLSAIPVSGSFADWDGTATFAGTWAIERFVVRDRVLFAIGTVDGTLTSALGATRSVTDQPVKLRVTKVSVSSAAGPSGSAPVGAQQPAQDCQILHLEFGGVTLDVLGVMVHLNPIVLDINLGGLLGGILCGLLGALVGGAPAQAQGAVLNRALGLLP